MGPKQPSNAASAARGLFLAPYPHAPIVEGRRLGLPENGGDGIAHRRRREDQSEALAELKHRFVQFRPAHPRPFHDVAGGKTAQESLVAADGGVMDVAIAIVAQRDPGAGSRIGGKIFRFVPPGWRTADGPLLGASGDKIVV